MAYVAPAANPGWMVSAWPGVICSRGRRWILSGQQPEPFYQKEDGWCYLQKALGRAIT
jgi:hypothetical protein